jgi:hypothetical protein
LVNEHFDIEAASKSTRVANASELSVLMTESETTSTQNRVVSCAFEKSVAILRRIIVVVMVYQGFGWIEQYQLHADYHMSNLKAKLLYGLNLNEPIMILTSFPTYPTLPPPRLAFMRAVGLAILVYKECAMFVYTLVHGLQY